MSKLKIAQDILDIIYPIGSIYITTINKDPKTYFGGNWESIPGDLYLLTTPVSQNIIGTGGSFYTNDTAISVDQMPWHNHLLGSGDGANGEFFGYAPETNPQGGWNHYYIKYAGTSNTPVRTINVKHNGGGQGHNHKYQPPYYQIWAWKRIS